MRRVRYLLPVAAVLALAGFAPARSETTLTVTGVYCNNNGGGTFGCFVESSCGTGTYVSHTIRWTERRLSTTYGPYTASAGSNYYVTGNCTVGWTLSITGTVTDSSGATASAATTFVCRSAAD